MNTKVLTGGALALAVVLLLAVNILSSTIFRSQRIDLTENRLYTLSEEASSRAAARPSRSKSA